MFPIQALPNQAFPNQAFPHGVSAVVVVKGPEGFLFFRPWPKIKEEEEEIIMLLIAALDD